GELWRCRRSSRGGKAGGRAHPHLQAQAGEHVRGLQALAAALTWAVVCAAILVVTASGSPPVAGGVRGAWTIALVAGLAVALTLGCVLSRLPLMTSYVAAHLAGAAVVLAVEQGPRPPWAWHTPPGLTALVAHGTASGDRTT